MRLSLLMLALVVLTGCDSGGYGDSNSSYSPAPSGGQTGGPTAPAPEPPTGPYRVAPAPTADAMIRD